ncbi:MAG: hypothetical protein IPJ04_13190 [Candidatus Eisenbacteria bacterium]|nr:hypothetical protein [Candidatus Eisenbacteria bacterium]
MLQGSCAAASVRGVRRGGRRAGAGAGAAAGVAGALTYFDNGSSVALRISASVPGFAPAAVRPMSLRSAIATIASTASMPEITLPKTV